MMQAGTMMAMQFLQAADMIARLPLPASLPPPKRQRPEYFGLCSPISSLLLLD
jgi:hypothetical protein